MRRGEARGDIRQISRTPSSRFNPWPVASGGRG
jgi:hypothetical protein